jgi:hypothetical protein
VSAERFVGCVIDRFLNDVRRVARARIHPGSRCTGSMPRSFLTELSSYFFTAMLGVFPRCLSIAHVLAKTVNVRA